MCNKCCKCCCCKDQLTIDDLVKGQRYRLVKSHLETIPQGSIVMCFSHNKWAGQKPFTGYRGVVDITTGEASHLEYNLHYLRFEGI